ncbi:unnamed protein product [Macrosiphum euphorbiae]|uniref:DUF4806 domain-containing protein n=1 Tax=Macrosiphum euphorbiae TaxID=13131 RepID=A0AAV0WUI5_9HEMI|nr:unnamed protein product [Macrosiphum euphorbiae]
MDALAKILQRNSKSFDTRRTTYLAMKITIHNRFADTLNMEGRRGEKLSFGKYKVCTTIIDCVKELYPQSTLLEIENHISDWLKQAPRR